jgi:hypothetical protein
VWHEGWSSTETHLRRLQDRLRADGIPTVAGGAFDRWDLIVRAGTLGAACVRLAVEDHGAKGQVTLYRVWPRLRGSLALVVALACSAAFVELQGARVVGVALAAIAALLLAESLRQAGKATGAVLGGLAMREAAVEPAAPARATVVVITAPPDSRPVEGAVAP